MKKIIVIAMMLSALTGFGTVIQQDTIEIGLNGSLDFENFNGKVATAGQLSLGYFVLDDIQVGGITGWGYDGDNFGWGLGPYGEINFDLDSAIVPYIAIRMTANFGDYHRSDHLLIEGAGGVKFFLSESVALAGELFYDLASKQVFINNERDQNTDIGLRVGIRSYF